MTKRADLTSGLYEKHYPVFVRVVICHDIVHRKNKGFAKQSLERSGFVECLVEILNTVPDNCKQQILGNVILPETTFLSFVENFSQTNCKCYINYHDEKMCTVEFVCKFETDFQTVLTLSDSILSELHLEIITPVGSVQV